MAKGVLKAFYSNLVFQSALLGQSGTIAKNKSSLELMYRYSMEISMGTGSSVISDVTCTFVDTIYFQNMSRQKYCMKSFVN